ncbi:hypothetical protein ACFFKU_00745 [Kineococcus gynurae]|uniref:Uncharacterized protein n=1 Tax=Kineococcus gynurae TaxID=452979 RepID=A0ABV5LPQ8_9ACTN
MSRKTIGVGVAGIVAASALGAAVIAPASADAEAGTASTSRVERLKDALAGLVGDGTLTQAQADTVADTLASSDALRGGPGGGHGGRLLDLEVAATTLNLTEDELRTALQADGATLATVAAAQDVPQQTLVDALVDAATTRLDQAVTDGRLTRAEADERIADLPTRVGEAVTSPLRGGRGDHGPGRGGRGPGDDPSDGSTAGPTAAPTTGAA